MCRACALGAAWGGLVGSAVGATDWVGLGVGANVSPGGGVGLRFICCVLVAPYPAAREPPIVTEPEPGAVQVATKSATCAALS